FSFILPIPAEYIAYDQSNCIIIFLISYSISFSSRFSNYFFISASSLFVFFFFNFTSHIDAMMIIRKTTSHTIAKKSPFKFPYASIDGSPIPRKDFYIHHSVSIMFPAINAALNCHVKSDITKKSIRNIPIPKNECVINKCFPVRLKFDSQGKYRLQKEAKHEKNNDVPRGDIHCTIHDSL